MKKDCSVKNMPISHLYIIKGKPYSNILSCAKTRYRNGYVYCITFTGNHELSRNYSIDDVVDLPFDHEETGDFRYRDKEGDYRIAHVVQYFGKTSRWIGVVQKTGWVDYLPENQARLERSVKDSSSQLLGYLSSVAALSTMQDDPEHPVSLSQKYERNKFVFSGGLFARYLNPSLPRKLTKESFIIPLIFPFGCNAEQWAATKNAVERDVSVIQGPPGTGKTQTILNILANLIIRGKTTQVVSYNNSAVDNVCEKLGKNGFGFLVAKLGKRPNKDLFFNSQTGTYPDLSAWKLTDTALSNLERRMHDTSSGLQRFFEYRERVAVLRLEIDELTKQAKVYSDVSIPSRACKHPSSKLYRLAIMCSDAEKKDRRPLRLRLASLFYGFGLWPEIHTIEGSAVFKNIYELKDEQRVKEEYIEEFTPKYDVFVDDSMMYFRAMIYRRFGKTESRKCFTPKELFTNPQAFLTEYPVVSSTIFSATSNLAQGHPFDTIIMDEASQADIAGGALSLNSAISAVIVGDDKQLPNVVTKKDKKEGEQLAEKYAISDEYRFDKFSFLSSAQKVFRNVPIVTLREHYRCEPRIIGFCNKQFYGGALIPMTRPSEAPPMRVIRTVEGNHARGLSNLRQAEISVDEAKRLYTIYGDNIGIIAPYNEQVSLISSLLLKAGMDIPVSTVHKFQGRESSAIILCTVDNEPKEFVEDPHLLNVAVSRAMLHFTLVVNGGALPDGNISDLVDYVANCSGEMEQSTRRSVFDILYSQYSAEREKFLSEHENVSEYASERIMFDLLRTIAKDEYNGRIGFIPQYPLSLLVPAGCVLTEEEREYANKSWTKVDFLIYNDTTKRPLLVIEVDGISFHKEGSEQWFRDRKKDSVLAKAGIKLLRLPTNGSEEKERIISALRD